VPSVNDIYTTPPPIKAIPPVSTNSLIQAISEAEHEIETAQNELSSVRSYLAHNRAIVTNWSSPLAMLPYELVQEIVSYVVVTPGQQHEIMRLSRVSKRWHEAVLGMPWLFTMANWNAWPHPLIELWCQRAGTQSLNISLGDQAICQLWSERDSKLMSLLHSCASRWGKLEIHFEDVGMMHKSVVEAVGRLLHRSTPSLHRLTLFTRGPQYEYVPTLPVMLDCPPPLTVSFSGVWVSFGDRSTSVTDLTLQLSRSDQLSRVADILNNCPLIQRLKLDLKCYSEGFVDFTRTTQMMLPSLVHLELLNIKTRFMADIGQILRCFDIPNLDSITVAPLVLSGGGLLPLLVKCYSCVFCSLPQPFILQERTIPNAQSISVLNLCSEYWGSPIYQFECLGMEPTIFPHLTELHMLYDLYYIRISDNDYSRLGEVIRDLVHFRKGSITHLTIPPLDDNIMESLKGHVPHLKVCHSSFHLLHVERLSSIVLQVGPPLKIVDE